MSPDVKTADLHAETPDMTATTEKPDTMVDTAVEIPSHTTIAIACGDLKLRRQLHEALRRVSAPVMNENCDFESLDDLVASVERLSPDILMLGLPGLPTDAAVVLARLAALEAAPRVIAVNDVPEAETILRTMRAGAAEFVYPPLASPAFREALQRVVVECGRYVRQERATGSVIGFVSAKGGCGATTLACHASSYIRRRLKKEILLADLDMASGITTSIMQAVSRYSLDDALQNLHRMDLKLWKVLVATAPSGVDVISAPPDNPAESMAMASRKLPQLLRFWRMQYDFTVADLGHGITQELLDSLDSLDTLVLVSTNEVLALRQAKLMIQSLAVRNFGANRLKLVINRMPKRTPIQIPELEKVMGHSIYASIPNDYERLNEAYSEPRLTDPNSDLGIEIGKFAARLAGVTLDEKKTRTFFGLRGKK